MQASRCWAIARRTAGLRSLVTGSTVVITQRSSCWSTRIRIPPTRSTRPTQASSSNGSLASISRLGRKRRGSSSLPTSPPSAAMLWVEMSESGIASKTPRSCLMTRTPSPSSAASAGSTTSSSSPPGVRTTVRESSGRDGSANDGR